MEVHKFGGASVKDAEAIRNLAKVVRGLPDHVVLIVSAMGETTNALEEVVSAYFKQSPEAISLLEQIRVQHHQTVEELEIASDDLLANLNDIFVEVEWILEEPISDSFEYIYDQIVAIGELLSTRIVSAYLHKEGLSNLWKDARDIIRTDESYRQAQVDWYKTTELCQNALAGENGREHRILTQGFIAGTADNNSTTLGREGSDFTGAIIASSLQADSLTLWKDVPGIMDGDPKDYLDAQLVPCLSYGEVINLTSCGAKIIHPKTIEPLQNRAIPLLVRSFSQPFELGTRVTSRCKGQAPPLRVRLKEMTMLEIRGNIAEEISGWDASQISDKGLFGKFYCLTLDPIRLVVKSPDLEGLRRKALDEGWHFESQKIQLELILNPGNEIKSDDFKNPIFINRLDGLIQIVTAR